MFAENQGLHRKNNSKARLELVNADHYQNATGQFSKAQLSVQIAVPMRDC